MADDNRHSSSGIIILVLMFVFFSFIHEEKERQIPGGATHTSVISNTGNAGLHAIINPALSTPGINSFRINTLTAKFACVECSSAREFNFDNRVSSSFNSPQVKFHFRNPIFRLFFLQKIPEQGKEDDILPIV